MNDDVSGDDEGDESITSPRRSDDDNYRLL